MTATTITYNHNGQPARVTVPAQLVRHFCDWLQSRGDVTDVTATSE